MARPPRSRPALAAAVAAAGALLYLAFAPPAVDLAAHTYRAALFGRQGLSVWDGGWYAGHHTPAYSLLFPPLGWLVGVRVAGALAAVAATALFAALARRPAAALWLAAGTTTLLLSGRLTFALGVAVGLGSLVALDRGLPALACALALVTALASPVAAAFLALAGLALAVGRRDASAALVTAFAVAAVALLAWAFPEGGYEPFPLSSYLPLVVLSLAAAIVLPRTLRLGAVLYAAAGTAAYLVHTPMGSNAARLGALVGGPVVAASVARRRAVLIAPLLIALAWWQWSDAVTDVAKVAGDPAAHASYYAPLVAELGRAGGPPGRVEIPFTRAHWEATEVAPRFALARGWERQLDIARGGLFYGREPLTAATYERWLAARAVRFVAVPDATLDRSAVAERRLILGGLAFLRLRWRSAHWRLYEVTPAAPLVAAQGRARMRAAGLAGQAVTLVVTRPGVGRVAVAWSPYWRLDGGCVTRSGAWTSVELPRPGRFRLAIDFSLARVLDRGRRCG